MEFKFTVGQPMKYKAAGGNVGLFTVVRQMRTYRIKSEHEGFERNVLECDLSASDKPGSMYGLVWKPRSSIAAQRWAAWHVCFVPNGDVRMSPLVPDRRI